MIVSNFRPLILTGILAGITMIATITGALVVLPSIIKLTGFSLDASESRSFFWRYFYIRRYFNLKT
jgi:hypothetical protein